MNKVLNTYISYWKQNPLRLFILLSIQILFAIFLYSVFVIYKRYTFLVIAPDPITIDKPNTKIEYFTYSGEKEKELPEKRVTVKFKDVSMSGYRFEIQDSFSKLPSSDAPIVISEGLKNYAEIYAQNYLDFSSSKNDSLPVEFYKTFRSSWKDSDDKAVFVYSDAGKLITCFEGSQVKVSATATKEIKEIHVDGHKAIIINSKYSIYKVGQLKDMHTKNIKIKKDKAANKSFKQIL